MIKVWQSKMVFENVVLICERPPHNNRRHYHSHLTLKFI